MKEKAVVTVIGGALAIGVMVDGFLRVGPWGAGLGLFTTIALMLVIVISRRSGHSIGGGALWLGVGAVSCAWMLALRDSPTLVGFDLVFCIALAVSIPGTTVGSSLVRKGPFEWLLTTCVAGADATFGALVFLTRDVPWPRVRKARLGRPTLAVIRGVLLAAPLLIVFALLLSAADAVFSKFLSELIDIDIEALALHVFLFGVGTWLGLGWLARAAGTRSLPDISLDLRNSPRLGLTEIAIILGAVDLLFLGFVIVQVRYFFGGADLVRTLPGLTWAEYARRGFFELVTVAALVLLLLLFIDWIADRSPGALVGTGVLSGVQVALVVVMLISAWLRMRLYVHEFGLTELRLYTTAFMVWLGIMLVWFCGTVVRGRRHRFAIGAIASGVIALLALNLANPDAIIVRTNVGRALAGEIFDASYLTRLSADAVPEIEASIEVLGSNEARELVDWLEARGVEDGDWRTWNLSRVRAKEFLESRRDKRGRDFAADLSRSSAPPSR